MNKVLVTGGAGFIGSNFIAHYLRSHSDVTVVNLDLLTYAGNLQNLAEVEKNPRYIFVKGDITDRPLIEKLFKDHDFHGVFHFAAESHVDNSISGPAAFIHTNILGTFQLIDVARGHWMSQPHVIRPGFEAARFLHVSTDEVYGALGDTGFFTEETPYAPNSPYSASKASSDHLVRSYHHTFGMNVVTTNCSNNFGPRQHSEKLIPTVIRSAIAGRPIPIYGKGANIRDWLYVQDHCEAIDLVFARGKSGETYNVGSRNEQKNLAICQQICKILDDLRPRTDGKSYTEQITFVADRPGHDFRYAIDPKKIETEIGWKAKADFLTNLKTTIQYYL